MDALKQITAHLINALAKVYPGLSSVEGFRGLARILGWEVSSLPAPILALSQEIMLLVATLNALLSGDASPSLSDYKNLGVQVKAVYEKIEALDRDSFAAIDVPGFEVEFPKQLADYILIDYLEDEYPSLYAQLKLLGIITADYIVPTIENRQAYLKKALHFSRIPQLLTDPKAVLQTALGWYDVNSRVDDFLQTFIQWAEEKGILVYQQQIPADTLLKLTAGHDADQLPQTYLSDLVFFEKYAENSTIDSGIKIFTIPPVDGLLPAIGCIPYLNGSTEQVYDFSDHFSFFFESSIQLNGNSAIKVSPENGIEIINGLNDGQSTAKIKGALSFGIKSSRPDDLETILFGSEDSIHLAYKTLLVEAGITATEQNAPDAFLKLALDEGKLLLKTSNSDGFLKHVLPEDGIEVNFSTGIIFSSQRGVYLEGNLGASLEKQFDTSIDLGPIRIKGLKLRLETLSNGLALFGGMDVQLELGPVQAVINDLGAATALNFPKNRNGNLGFMDLSAAIPMPSGIGISIDAKAVKGGGFLSIDADKGEYIGFAELAVLDKFALKAIAIINTKLPDNQPGYSFLLMITAEFNPLPLGLGFTLEGVGGIIGLHRGLSLENIQTGVKSGKHDYILFPQDPLSNLPAIITGLNEFMPIESDHYAFGIMLRLGWGSPKILDIKLGLIFEIPNWEIALIGVAKAEIKPKDKLLARLQLNFAITFDPQKALFAIDASLTNSKLLMWTLSGDLALRIRGGSDPYFLISAGGFHKDFQPPSGLRLPKLDRLKISMADGNPNIYAEVFFAITSNTIQFGAEAHASYSLWGIGFEADLGFAALIQFDPLYFKAEVWGGVYLKFFGASFGLDLKGTIEGPRPLVFNLYVTFKIWIFSKTVRVPEIRIGEGISGALPEVAIWPILKEQLEDERNWQPVLPRGAAALVSLKADPDGTSDTSKLLKFHPVGDIQISQNRVPINLRLDRFGHYRPSDYQHFTLQLDGKDNQITAVQEFFAPAQFFDLSEEDQFTAKAYEKYDAGVNISTKDTLITGTIIEKTLGFEELILDVKKQVIKRKNKPETEAHFELYRANNSIAQSSVGRRHWKENQGARQGQQYQQKEVGYTVIDSFSMTPIPEANKSLSESEARLLLQKILAKHPALEDRLDVIPLYEMEGSMTV